jgi:hypothetical protein
MVSRIFNDGAAWLILAVIAVAAFVIALILKDNLKKSNDKLNASGGLDVGDGALIGLEAVILTVLGGLVARAFISFLMGWANESAAAGVAVGWGFFLIPGIVGTIPFLTHSSPLLTDVGSLLMIATLVGGMSGAMNGLWRIYDWGGLGWIAFPLDVTWALAGNTLGCLLHIINFAWGDHGDEPRPNAHRYASGFRLQSGFAFTQGAVMSDLTDTPGQDLYRHEVTHVWQDRIFGPMYTLTYLGWMVVWLVPSLIFGVIKVGTAGFASGPKAWCYFNNPWEVRAYAVQGVDRKKVNGVTANDAKLIWSAGWVIFWSIIFFLIAAWYAVRTVKSVWLDQTPLPSSQIQQPKKTKPPANQHPAPSKPKH